MERRKEYRDIPTVIQIQNKKEVLTLKNLKKIAIMLIIAAMSLSTAACSKPVSYTHLDVYKRQDIGLSHMVIQLVAIFLPPYLLSVNF